MSSRPRPAPAAVALLIAVPVLFIGYFFIYPLGAIILRGLAPDGRLTAQPFIDVFTDRGLRGVAWFTLWQAIVSTLATVLIGLPGAYVLARFTFPGKRIVRALTLVPFVLPTLVVGTAFLALLGPSGFLGIDLRGSIWAILLAHVFYNYAIVVRGVGTYWEQIDPRIEDAARVLGANRWRTFRTVTLPLLRPAIVSSAALVFLFSFTSFGVILILGDLRHTTLEVEIWRQATAFLRLDIAAALAVLQLIGVGAILILYSRYQERRSVQLSLLPPAQVARRPSIPAERAMVAGNLIFMALFLGIPLAVLVVRSLQTRFGFGFQNYVDLVTNPAGTAAFVPPIEAVGNSLLFALGAIVIAGLIGLTAAIVISYVGGRTGRTFDTALMLPLGTSAVTIGFGFLIALDRPIDLRASLVLISIAHALVAIPFVVRTSVPVMRSVQHRLREAAAVLGASPARAWREVDLPLISRALLVGAAFAFAVSVGEFGATAFIARPATPTLPIAIFRLLGRPGTFGHAMALSVLLMALTAAAVVVIESVRGSAAGDL
jgi:thiamine transport system permease protein